jgi:hypothetical protein
MQSAGDEAAPPAQRETQFSFTNLTASRRPRSKLAKLGITPTTPVLAVTASGCGGESESESELPARILEEEQSPLSTQTPAEPESRQHPGALTIQFTQHMPTHLPEYRPVSTIGRSKGDY